jgi:hypothetical protein
MIKPLSKHQSPNEQALCFSNTCSQMLTIKFQLVTRDACAAASLSLTHVLSHCSQESWNSIRALGGDPDSSGIEALKVRKVGNAMYRA